MRQLSQQLQGAGVPGDAGDRRLPSRSTDRCCQHPRPLAATAGELSAQPCTVIDVDACLTPGLYAGVPAHARPQQRAQPRHRVGLCCILVECWTMWGNTCGMRSADSTKLTAPGALFALESKLCLLCRTCPSGPASVQGAQSCTETSSMCTWAIQTFWKGVLAAAAPSVHQLLNDHP